MHHDGTSWVDIHNFIGYVQIIIESKQGMAERHGFAIIYPYSYQEKLVKVRERRYISKVQVIIMIQFSLFLKKK